ncbi:MAG: indole-3-glycerol phosphate synthase TrpC [Alphaproteobacteria bacterium]|nr:indole-3-glycerol phosphate synthase TrpC [Alphaproteobacteria bacterium]
MSDVLAQICRDKREAVRVRKLTHPQPALERDARAASPARPFAAALAARIATGKYGLIAEIKKASPSRGLIREDFDPPAIAQAYRRGGAACLSVLTDEKYFGGHDDFVAVVRDVVDLPVLRKDFMLDPYQIVESRVIGADCVLLIMAVLDDDQAADLEAAAAEFGMDALIEVHDAAELERALKLQSTLIGINNRNLKTLKTDIATTEELAPLVPSDRLLVCESGLDHPRDLARMAAAGAHSFLVGTSLMAQPDIESATRKLLDQSEPARATA